MLRKSHIIFCVSKKKCNFAASICEMNKKADQNIALAQHLLNNHIFPTESVHCSYYAVLQYMKYYLAVTTSSPISYDEQRKKACANGQSHEFLIDETQLHAQSTPSKIHTFIQSVRDLKKKRVEADYYEKVFTEDEALTCKEQAESLIRSLKDFYRNIV